MTGQPARHRRTPIKFEDPIYEQAIRTIGYGLTVAVDTSSDERYTCQVRARQFERIEAWIDELQDLLDRYLPNR